MANPRKFSEKIALHTQKQAEGTAAFEAILKEVSATTRGIVAQQPPNQQPTECPPLHTNVQRLAQPTTHVYRGCSLPNVNQVISNTSINLRNALSSLEDIKSQTEGRSPSGSRHSISEKPRGIPERSSSHPRKHTSLTRHRDISPYGSMYLSPPADASWRRVSSDSAIHSSVFGGPNQQSNKLLVNCEQVYSNDNITVCFGSPDINGGQLWASQNNSSRPKSCDVPGISIYPSPELLNSVHFQLAGTANGSGSLPNLNSGLQSRNNMSPEVVVGSLPQKLLDERSHILMGREIGRLQRQVIPSPLVLSENDLVIVNGVSTDGENSTVNVQPQMASIMPNLSFPDSLYIQTYNQNNYHKSPNNNFNNMESITSYPVQLNSTTLQMLLNSQQQVSSDGSILLNHSPNSGPIILNQNGSQNSGPIILNQNGSPNSGSPSHQSLNSQQQLIQAVLNNQHVLNIQKLQQLQQQLQQQEESNCIDHQNEMLQEQIQLQHLINMQQNNQLNLATLLTNSNLQIIPEISSTPPINGAFFPNSTASPGTTNECTLQPKNNILAEAAAKQRAAVVEAVSNLNVEEVKEVLQGLNGCHVNQQQRLSYVGEQQQYIQQKFRQISVGTGIKTISKNLTNQELSDLYFGDVQTGLNADSKLAGLHGQNSTDSNGIPNIILTAEDIALYNQSMNEENKSLGLMDMSQGSFDEMKDAFSCLGDSLEGDIFVSDDVLRLALDPLELEELQMLADSSILTDAATEDSFRMDRRIDK